MPIISLFIILSSLLSIDATQLQVFKKAPDETLQQFGKRIIPKNMKLTHPVVKGDFGPSKGNIVVLFHEDDYREFTGWVLVPEGTEYRRFILPKVRLPVSTAIEAVFFDNADNDPEKELLILCKHISGAGRYRGNITPFWTTYVYDWSGSGFTWLEDVTINLDAVGRTRDVESVRRLLRKLGY